MEKLTEQSCAEFVRLLASKASVPGGGGGAALAGALGIALCSMAGQFTLGKKKYASVEDDIQAMLVKADAIRTRLLELVDADAEAFAPLSQAYAIPKEDPNRAGILEKATQNACTAPLQMTEQCAQAIELLEEMLEKGSQMLVSDVGCGALLCKAALESAAMNVYINTKSLQDRQKAEAWENRTDRLLQEYGPRADRIARTVTRRIRGEG